jgi:pyridoxamine--pyruvate transaminase
MSFTTGPLEMTERTLRDQARQLVFHQDPAFIEMFDRASHMLQAVYRTRHTVVIMQAEALLGLEAAAACLISPGDVVLNLVSGPYGKWYELYIQKYGGQAIELAVPYNQAIDPDDVRRMLRRHPGIKFLSMVHSDTPCGTVNPVGEIGRIAREFGVVTIMDTVSGLAGEPICPEEDGIDLAVAGPHKFLGGTPGLSLLCVSPAAWDAMERRASPLRGSYLSILDWKDTWLAQRRFPHTPSVGEVYALESCLSQVLEFGLDRYAARHRLIAEACRAGARGMGLQPWPASDAIASSAVTTVHLPAGITEDQLRARLRERYGIMLAPGPAIGAQVFRMSHMAKMAHPAFLTAQLAMVERALADLGAPVRLGQGVGAALDVLGRWEF